MHQAFLCISLPFLHELGRETSFLFLYLYQSLRIDSTENFPNVRKIEWNAARVMKFETARIRFSSDVFTAVVRSRLLKLHIKKGEISSKFGTLLRNGMYHVKRNNGKK